MSEKRNTVDFGAPADFGAHIFRVEIPAARTGEIWIIEDYGYRGGEAGIPRQEARAVLERRVWSQIADAAQRDFNPRLKAAGLKAGRWHVGSNLLDRMLGRELCVLAWAAEKATDDELPVIASKWAALRPEERWWLFIKTAAEAGHPDDYERGWRRALRLALADAGGPRPGAPRRRPPEPELDMPLFAQTP